MKKLWLVMIFMIAGLTWGQGEYDQYEDHDTALNDEQSSDVTAEEIISNEPLIISSLIVETGELDNTPEMDMTASVEAKISEFSKYLNIPIWYRWREFSFSASIPYIYEKKKSYGYDWSEEKVMEETTNGIGDISVGTSYGKYLEDLNTYFDVNLSVKLPTGDEENTVKLDSADAANYYIEEVDIPLGTGSLDLSGSFSGYYFMDDFTFKATALYKMNGKNEDKGGFFYNGTENIADPETDYGDLFVFNAGIDYRLPYRFTAGINLVYGMKFADEIEGDDQENGLNFMDINPTIKYTISLFDFVGGAKIPVSTKSELASSDDPWDQENRSFSFFFRTNYRLF